MATTYNPSSITDGLALCLDAGRPGSYSSNVHPKPVDLYGWCGASGGNNITLSRETNLTSPAGGYPLKMVQSGTDAYTSTYSNPAYNLSPAASGETWTVSVWVMASASLQIEGPWIAEANSSGSYLGGGGSPYPTLTAYTWTRISGTYTTSNASCAYVQVRLDGAQPSTNVTIWWDGLQLEKSSTATTFNPRPNINGASWNDMTNNVSAGTVVGRPSFSSTGGGSLVFTGSQYATITNALASRQGNYSQAWTVAGWLNINDAANQNLLNFNQGIFPSYGSNNSLLYLNSGTNDYYTYGGDVGGLGWSHVVFRFANVDGTRTIWRNGASITSSGPNNTSTPSGLPSTATIASNFQGNLARLEVYDRVLSDADVTKIFNAQRTRFGV